MNGVFCAPRRRRAPTPRRPRRDFPCFHAGRLAWETWLTPGGGELFFSRKPITHRQNRKIRTKPRLSSSRFCLFCGAKQAKTSPAGESPGRRFFCPASSVFFRDQFRGHLGLVYLSQTQSGTLFREVHLASEMGCKHIQNRLLPAVCDLAPKARKTFFKKAWSQRAHFFLYIAAPRVSMQTLLQSYSANKPREPRRSVISQRYKPHLANHVASVRAKMCLNAEYRAFFWFHYTRGGVEREMSIF